MIQVFVHGIPKGQPRPRAFAVGGRARVYDPGTAEGWKSSIAQALRDQLPDSPITGPVGIRLSFFMPRPKSHFRTGRHGRELRQGAPWYHSGKPDADNLAKAVFDAMTALGVWHDDDQVAQLDVFKAYALPGGPSGCMITVQELDEPIPEPAVSGGTSEWRP